MAAKEPIQAQPLWCQDIPKPIWQAYTYDQRRALIAATTRQRGTYPKPPVPVVVPAAAAAPQGAAPIYEQASTSPAVNQSPSATTPLKSIRDWYEDVDGIPGERIRACIIFLLDVKKDQWYRSRLTPSFVRKFATKLNDETPLEFSLDPMIKLVNVDGSEISKIVRSPKNSDEWELLHDKYLFNSRGKANSNVVPHLVHKDCKKCGGKGGYNAKVNPDFKSKTRVNFNEYYHYPCDCVHDNPFKS